MSCAAGLLPRLSLLPRLLLLPLLMSGGGCGRRQPPPPARHTPAPQAELSATPRYPRVRFFPMGNNDTLRVEIHYAHDNDTIPLASGATITYDGARPLSLEGDLETQDYWTLVDSLSGRDLNADKIPDIVLVRGNGAACEQCRNLIVVSLVNGEPRVISPEPFDGQAPRAMKDLRHTGRYQLLMMDTSWEEAHGFSQANSPRPYRVRGWNGRSYVDSTPAYPDFLRNGIQANLEAARRIEATEGPTEKWLSNLVEAALYARMLGQGRALLDTLRTHLATHPPADPRLRATASDVELTLAHQLGRKW